MEEIAQTPTYDQSLTKTSKTPRLFRSRKFIMTFALLVVILLLVTTTFIGFSKPQKPLTPPSQTTKISPSPTPAQAKEMSAKDLIDSTYSPILEYAKKSGKLKTQVSTQDELTTLNSETINNLNELTKALRTTETTYINAEVVTLWFNNFYPEKYTLEERKAIVMKNMNDLHNRVASGKLTMKQAGDILSGDESLKDVDSAWKSNSYRILTYAKKNVRSFLDPEVEKQFWLAQKGELSPLIISHMPDAPGNPEGSILFFKINEREDKEYDSYEEIVNTFK